MPERGEESDPVYQQRKIKKSSPYSKKGEEMTLYRYVILEEKER
jgi:hypothetical protein